MTNTTCALVCDSGFVEPRGTGHWFWSRRTDIDTPGHPKISEFLLKAILSAIDSRT
jgi:hypothetical protein